MFPKRSADADLGCGDRGGGCACNKCSRCDHGSGDRAVQLDGCSTGRNRVTVSAGERCRSRTVGHALPEPGTPRRARAVLHHDRRVVADGVPGRGEPPDQIDVLAIPQRRVEPTDRVDRCHSDDQRRSGDIGNPPTGCDERRSTAEVEGREGLLVRCESGVTGHRHDTRRHRRNGRIVEVPEQSVDPVGT